MDQPLSQFILENLQADSVGSIVIRGVIWLILVTIFAYGVGKGKSMTRIKSEAGFFLLFILLTAVAIYFAFGFIPTLTTIDETSLLVPLTALAFAVISREPSQLHRISSYFQ